MPMWIPITAAFLANILYRVFVIRDSIFPLLPPLSVLTIRFCSLLKDKEMSLKTRMRIFGRELAFLGFQVVFSFLSTVDDIFFPGYRACTLVEPVFIVGGFRTGSTSLHRALALDAERFVSPRFTELMLPFLSVHFMLDMVEWFDGRMGTGLCASLERALQKTAGPDVMARHPMTLKDAEECDVLLSVHQRCGYYAFMSFPIVDTWETCGAISRLSPREKAHTAALYRRSMQKVLYRRGHGRQLLSKSHLIDCMDLWAAEFPGARFINICRHPRDVFPSWVALAQAATRMLTGWQLPLPAAVKAHLDFWDIYYAKERAFFTGAFETSGGQGNGSMRMSLRFLPFVKEQLGTMRTLYECWGYPFEGTMFEARLVAGQNASRAYKSVHKYKNPTLLDLGLTDSLLCERYAGYVTALGLDDPPAIATER